MPRKGSVGGIIGGILNGKGMAAGSSVTSLDVGILNHFAAGYFAIQGGDERPNTFRDKPNPSQFFLPDLAHHRIRIRINGITLGIGGCVSAKAQSFEKKAHIIIQKAISKEKSG